MLKYELREEGGLRSEVMSQRIILTLLFEVNISIVHFM
jgi:hypothetical protein